MANLLPPYTSSIHYDRRLYKQDIAGSIAHARMLAKQGIILDKDAELIVMGLTSIRQEIQDGTFPWKEDLEDIHMNIEARLFDKVGPVAGKLHTARSRNDQIALDMRLYVKEVIGQVLAGIRRLQKALLEQAESHQQAVMPGYTHLQRAQPVLFAHHMLAYFQMLARDAQRFQEAYQRTDVLPLGGGALAGIPYPIDREFVAKELGFSRIAANSMDAVSDRDFVVDFHAAAATCMMHLSRLAEELTLWSSEEFGFVSLHPNYTTGSSIMPQKRNPDFAELARGKTGRVYGHLMGVLTLLKGLPLAYNRDLQEDKEGLFDTVDTLLPTLGVFAGMISTMTLSVEKMRRAVEQSYILATDLADYLVSKGASFRDAHGVVAGLSAYAQAQGKGFHKLTLDEYRRFSPHFQEDVFAITVESSVAARNTPGGTSPKQVARAIADAKAFLKAQEEGCAP